MSFDSLFLRTELLSAIAQSGYTQPTAIQAAVIPGVQRGRDVLASAQTGSGKTASFALPILNLFDEAPPLEKNQVQNLVLVPTRELAQQVFDQFKHYGQDLRVRCAVVYGGVSINPQLMQLRRGAHILIATPGRLLDLMSQNAVRYDQFSTLVLDEADRMLDLGFRDDLDRICDKLPTSRQNLLFSATFSPSIRDFARTRLRDPLEVDTAPKVGAASSVKHWLHPVDKKLKPELLLELVETNGWVQLLVFCKTKRGVDKLVKLLQQKRFKAVGIHGDKSQRQRTEALSTFKRGQADILVATDVAARGLDIEDMPVVVNFDLPRNPEDYVHRIGRTGRAGKTGNAVSLVAADEIEELKGIERLLQKQLERRLVDGFEPDHDLPSSPPIRPARAAKKPKKPKSRSSDGAQNTDRAPRSNNRRKPTRGGKPGSKAAKPGAKPSHRSSAKAGAKTSISRAKPSSGDNTRSRDSGKPAVKGGVPTPRRRASSGTPAPAGTRQPRRR
ncbi:DEAD/DEAH box helicase [uncultured Umboniibacter sp.]|uniref:DEAD/DEAH box helicase n=1 Tax=uncultured Umboniibacter sp. TaxID=1798917 RepID=UPI002604F988|nr:DEAD/DEAH box helicase [uncultured Umboniibacter sp.]